VWAVFLVVKDLGLLGCDIVWFGEWFLMFRRLRHLHLEGHTAHLLAQRHSVMTQKTCIFISTAIKTSDLMSLYISISVIMHIVFAVNSSYLLSIKLQYTNCDVLSYSRHHLSTKQPATPITQCNTK
jgi:hypothetical protein